MHAPRPKYQVLYNARDITEDITPFLVGLAYTDHVKGKSDSMEIQVEDTDLIWQNEWYPAKGDQLDVSIGYDLQLVPCGLFEIDEIEVSGPPDQVSIRALAAGITSALRTRRSYAYEGQTLRNLAETIAARHGFTIQGDISEIRINRTTQHKETDLRFLSRMAAQYGHVFSVRGQVLTFTEIYGLEGLPSVQVVSRQDLISYSFRDKTSETYQTARVKYHDPETQEVVEGAFDESDEDTAGDGLEIWTKAESNRQANTIARSELHNANTRKLEGVITLEGNPYLVAGNNIEIEGMGVMSGLFHIQSSSHSITPNGGYATTCEVKRVGAISSDRWKGAGRAQRFDFVT